MRAELCQVYDGVSGFVPVERYVWEDELPGVTLAPWKVSPPEQSVVTETKVEVTKVPVMPPPPPPVSVTGGVIVVQPELSDKEAWDIFLARFDKAEGVALRPLSRENYVGRER